MVAAVRRRAKSLCGGIECKGVTGTLPQQRHIKGFGRVVVGPQRGMERKVQQPLKQ